MIYFTSDTHFQHGNVIKLSRRPFETVEEMNATMVGNWQERVGADDVIYHLGDFAWTWNRETKAILASLPGQKHLITGNHDHSGVRKAPEWASVQAYLEVTVPLADGREQMFVLFHYPIIEWNGYHRGAINLYGHVHGARPIARQQMDVGVDACGFRPISLDGVMARLDAVE